MDKLANNLCQNSSLLYSKLVESIVPFHASNRLPKNYLVIDCINEDFFHAVQHLSRQDVIGLSLEGCEIGRFGSLKWFNISSSTCTYLFYIASLGTHVFNKGLKKILENKRIVKVIHDCRRASDCFRHHYYTKLANVYDTQVADFVVNAIKKRPELITNKVNSLDYCLNLYLNVPKAHLFEHTDASVKLDPLNSDSLQFLIKNVIYLRMLKQELDRILRMPFRRCVDMYLNVLMKQDDELQLENPNSKQIPPKLVMEYMEVFNITDKIKPSKVEVKDDPYVKYEKDKRKYQKYRYKKYANDKELESNNRGWNYSNDTDWGNWSSSSKTEVFQFLFDKMFTGDSDNTSDISMTPFENLSECSVVFETDVCNVNSKHDLKHEGRTLPTPHCSSRGFLLSENELSPACKLLGTNNKIDQPFENISSSSARSLECSNLFNDKTFPCVKEPLDPKATDSSSDLLISQKQLDSEPAFLSKDSISAKDLSFSKNNSYNLKNSVSDNSSGKSSGKSWVSFSEKLKEPIASHKVSTNQRNLGSESLHSSHMQPSLTLKKASVQTSSSICSFSQKSALFSEKLKKLNASHKGSTSQCNIENKSSHSSSVQPSLPLKEANRNLSANIKYGCFKNSSKNRPSDFLRRKNFIKNKSLIELDNVSHVDNLDTCYCKENNNPVCVVQDDDPWPRLRGAFSELRPTRYSDMF